MKQEEKKEKERLRIAAEKAALKAAKKPKKVIVEVDAWKQLQKFS